MHVGKRSGSALALAVIVGILLATIRVEASAQTAFTLDDVLSYRRLVDTRDLTWLGEPSLALFSPDRSAFALHTTRGDVTNGKNVEEIFIYNTGSGDCGAGSHLPVMTARAAFQAEHRRDVGRLSWIADHQLAFVAPDARGVTQVFVLDSQTSAVRQITHHSSDVLSFDIQSDIVVFLARSVPPERPAANLAGRQLDDVLFPRQGISRDYYQRVELFETSLTDSAERRLSAGPYVMTWWFQSIEISPDARYAIVLQPAVDWPHHWAEYEVPFPEVFAFTPDRRSYNPDSDDLVLTPRYMIVDLDTGATRPLLDAPLSNRSRNGTPLRVFWTADSSTVVISASWMPLNPAVGRERFLRARRPATVAVNVRTGIVTRIIWEPTYADINAENAGGGGRIQEVSWNSSEQTLTLKRRVNGTPLLERWRHTGGRWTATRTPDVSTNATSIVVDETLNSPGSVLLRRSPECLVQITNLNSWVQTRAIASTEQIQWTDSQGRSWQGALLLPADYVEGVRYPLILQTHGFSPHEFLVDGPATGGGGGSAFAARVLSATGFAVLQVGDPDLFETAREEEAEIYADGYRAGIQAIVNRGLADPSRVGAIGWSATGRYLQHLLVESPGTISTVIFSDTGYFGYASFLLGLDTVLAAQWEIASGGPVPWADLSQISRWIQGNEFYDFVRLNVPMRVEAIGPSALLYSWEFFALRTHTHLPTDLVFYPNGEHSLYDINERRTSLQGTVDWFRFWLQAYEDRDDAKVDQYRRWREMRDGACRLNDATLPRRHRVSSALPRQWPFRCS